MSAIIACLYSPVAAGREELAQQCRSLRRRGADMLVFVDHHTSNEPIGLITDAY
jgi:hypothetical protein